MRDRDDAIHTVQVWTRVGGLWRRNQTIVGLTEPNDQFGGRIALSGTTLIVGAPMSHQGRGAVFEVKLSNGQWINHGIIAPVGSEVANFGASVAVAPFMIAVGAPRADEMPPPAGCGTEGTSGAVYIFRPDVGAGVPWLQTDKIQPPPGACRSNFGSDVALSVQRLAIGSMFIDAGSPGDPLLYRFDHAPQVHALIGRVAVGSNSAPLAVTDETFVAGAPFPAPDPDGRA